MSHLQQKEFCKLVSARFPQLFTGKFVVDIGSLDINGNNRNLFDDCLYIGVDVAPGRNVDIVSFGHELALPDESADTIISTECFEHDRYYTETLNNICRMLKPGGMLLFTCATVGRSEHGTRRVKPEDAPLLMKFAECADYYKNLTEEDIRAAIEIDSVFDEYQFLVNEESHDLYFYGIKRGEYRGRSDYSFLSYGDQFQIFWDVGGGFNEEHSLLRRINGISPDGPDERTREFAFDVSSDEGVRALRVDPLNDSAVLQLEGVVLETSDGEVDLLPRLVSNANVINEDTYYFGTDDPQFYFPEFDPEGFRDTKRLVIRLRFLRVGSAAKLLTRLWLTQTGVSPGCIVRDPSDIRFEDILGGTNGKATRYERLLGELAELRDELQLSRAAAASHQSRIERLDRLIAERDAEVATLHQLVAQRDEKLGTLVAETSDLAQMLEATRVQLEMHGASAFNRWFGSLRKVWEYIEFDVLRRNLRFMLQANSDLQRIDASGYSWKSTGDDPFFILKPVRGSFPSGWILIDTVLERKADDYTLKIYFDEGHGFSEASSAILPVSGKGRVYELLKLPARVYGLRWDPLQSPGEFKQETICISEVAALERLFLMVRRVLPMLWKQPPQKRLPVGLTWSRLATDIGGAYKAAGKLRNILQTDFGLAYEDWIRRNDNLGDDDRKRLKEEILGLRHRPLISVLVPVYNTPLVYLREAIESVRAQLYDRWELCVADDASTEPHVKETLEEYRRNDPRIKVIYRETNGHISAASNSALELASGEFVALLDHDDRLSEQALYHVVRAINENPDGEIFYSDEDKIDEGGKRFNPHFKSNWNPDLLLSQNYVSHLGVYATSLVRGVGGFRVGFEGSQDYDLLLRCVGVAKRKEAVHIPMVLYHWRSLGGSTARHANEKSYTTEAGIRALQEYFQRIGRAVRVEQGLAPNTYHVEYPIPSPQPLVSLLIPTRDKLHLVKTCVDSILQKTTYSNYEIVILDNQSQEAETLAWFEEIKRDQRIRVLRYDHPFNFSAINNFGVQHAMGGIIGLINNDIEVISEGWLTEMVSHVCRPEVGCVGAKLYYDNDTIQHAGVIVGLGGVAGHSHKYYPRKSSGYFLRLKLVQNLTAVTAACLLVRREVYEQVGGLNEAELTVAFNDVDFCLKVREAGYLNVWTPYAELYHHESLSRGAEDSPEKVQRFQREIEYMKSRWGDTLAFDRYYSKWLTRSREDFTLG